jgi:hypothetical protein
VTERIVEDVLTLLAYIVLWVVAADLDSAALRRSNLSGAGTAPVGAHVGEGRHERVPLGVEEPPWKKQDMACAST